MERSWLIVSLVTSAIFISKVRCQQPSIVESVFSAVKREWDTGYLNCTVHRLQSNSLIWRQGADNWISRDDQIIAINEVLNGQQKYELIRTDKGNDTYRFTLVINRLREEDGGQYSCTVMIQGQEPNRWPTQYGNLTVQTPPTMIATDTPDTVKGNQRESVSFKCRATGNPMPNISWIRADDKPLPDGRMSHMGHVLNITDLKAEDTGLYRCIADNGVVPKATRDYSLYVNFKPVAQAIEASVAQVQNQMFHAILECRIKGVPDSRLRWYRVSQRGDRELLNDNEKYDINKLLLSGTSSGEVWFSLKIANIQANDYGVYYCEAVNFLGNTEAKIVLYDAPESSSIVGNIPNQEISVGQTLQLDCVVNRTTQVKVYWNRWIGGGYHDISLGDSILAYNPELGSYPNNKRKYESDVNYVTDDVYIYRLTINYVTPTDAGVYTCELLSPGRRVQVDSQNTTLSVRESSACVGNSCPVTFGPWPPNTRETLMCDEFTCISGSCRIPIGCFLLTIMLLVSICSTI